MRNTELWDKLGKTDPAHTKGFKRGGGFTGTAIKPMWTYRRMTEEFGPCGTGWGVNEPSFQVVPGDNREVLVYCTVSVWYEKPEKVSYGVGGDKIVTHIRANERYNRPERWESDDEAFKKAYTDAVTNALKMIGVGADVHMGLFDDSKYVADARKHFEETQPDNGPENGAEHIKKKNGKYTGLSGPHETKTALQEAMHSIATDLEKQDADTLKGFMLDNVETLQQVARDFPEWWHGKEGSDVKGMKVRFQDRCATLVVFPGDMDAVIQAVEQQKEQAA